MTVRAAIPILAAICLVNAAEAQKPNKGAPVAKPPAEPQHIPSAPTPPPNRPRPAAQGGPGSAENLDRLLKLSPEQRKKYLSALPPARRAQIEKRLSDYEKMPEPERTRTLEKLRLMQKLPPQKQSQVRASLKRFPELPEQRHKLVKRQINQLTPLSEVDRRAMMNTEEFRNKFTPAEQQMIEDICLVTPQEKLR